MEVDLSPNVLNGVALNHTVRSQALLNFRVKASNKDSVSFETFPFTRITFSVRNDLLGVLDGP
jgi:hypothetical protein